MPRSFLKAAGYTAIVYGIFWIVVASLGFVYLMSDGANEIVKSAAVVDLCDLFFNMWYTPALKIFAFKGAPGNTGIIFWCVATLVVMFIFIIGGIKLLSYSKETYDLKENVSKTVLFIIFTGLIIGFSIFAFVQNATLNVFNVLNFVALGIMFFLPAAESIRETKD